MKFERLRHPFGPAEIKAQEKGSSSEFQLLQNILDSLQKNNFEEKSASVRRRSL